MTFIPFIPPPGASPRVYELGRRLADTIEAYRREHPDLSRHEVRRALREARRQQGVPDVRLAFILIAPLVALVGGLIASLSHGPGVAWKEGPMVLLIMAAVAVIGVAAILSRR
jgi:hypothetical protein